MGLSIDFIYPHYDTLHLMYSKTAQGKIFKQHNFFLTHALKKHCEQLLPERTSLYMRDLENGGVGWATTSLSRFFCMHAQILFMRWRSCTSIPIEA
jgi:hypothetical protein